MNPKITDSIFLAAVLFVGCGRNAVDSPDRAVGAKEHIQPTATPPSKEPEEPVLPQKGSPPILQAPEIKDGIAVAKSLVERKIASAELADLSMRLENQQKNTARLRKTVNDLSDAKKGLSGFDADRADVQLVAAERNLAINAEIEKALVDRLSALAMSEYRKTENK